MALASALWATDALFRRGLALDLPATTVVVWEHAILAAITAPWLLRIPWRRLSGTDLLCLVVIGAGASALATGLFTAAFQHGDVNAPLLLQKLQPVVAVIGARIVLGERLRPRFGLFAAAALLGGWMITFPDPLTVDVASATAGAFAAAAALLWAFGTVLGRRMSDRLSPAELTAARFGIGLPAAIAFATVGPGRADSMALEVGDLMPLVALALIPGLLALSLYYRGLRRTPASAATLAELAFPLSALAINYLAFGAVLTRTQLAGTVLLSGTLVALGCVARGGADRIGVVSGGRAGTREGGTATPPREVRSRTTAPGA